MRMEIRDQIEDILELKYNYLGNILDFRNKERIEDAIIKKEIHLKILKFKGKSLEQFKEFMATSTN